MDGTRRLAQVGNFFSDLLVVAAVLSLALIVGIVVRAYLE